MREVLQLKLRCLECSMEIVIAMLPWPVRSATREGFMDCSKCGKNRYEAYLFKALVVDYNIDLPPIMDRELKK
jgi:transcription elongation factor Elf1